MGLTAMLEQWAGIGRSDFCEMAGLDRNRKFTQSFGQKNGKK
jgi:hypothetical protein